MPAFVSKERVERDGVLVYPEGVELPLSDVDEIRRQYPDAELELDGNGEVVGNVSKERVERDGVLVYAEGDPIPDADADELARQGLVSKTEARKMRKAAENKALAPEENKAAG
jgi:hypothetical protein